MSDIRFNRWLHQSGTGGVFQDSSGRVGIGTSLPTSALDVQSGTIKIGNNTLSSSGVSTFTTVNATSIIGVNTIGVTTAYITSINQGPISGARNIIINGSMDINQRGWTGAAGTTTSGSYVTDRFFISHLHDGAVSVGQTSMNSTVGGDAFADGFKNALFFRVNTADASLAAGQYQQILQRVEGFNVQGIKKGTANALPVTLSFWCRSTTTGTYCVEIYDNDNARLIAQTYTISSANTWEKKIITFPADTTGGSFDNDNNASLQLLWWLAAGSDYSSGTLQTSWAAIVNANRAVGQVNLLASSGNNFWLTGVQLEVGSVATPFERRSYGQELALCQRYFYLHSNSGDVEIGMAFSSGPTTVLGNMYFPTMRTAPSLYSTLGSGAKFRWNSNVDGQTSNNPTLFSGNENSIILSLTNFSPDAANFTTGYCGKLRRMSSQTGVFGLQSEL